MNSKGQAAITDALYFLMIITVLSVFLFGFANNYGNSVKQKINDEYSTTFATNALKTILYSSTPRDSSQSIYDRDAEIDFLLAILKEDYSDDQVIGDREKLVLADTITSILAPISDSADYAFYITIPNDKKLVYFFIHLTNFKKEGPFNPGRYYIYSPGDPPHIDYFCGVKPVQDSDYRFEPDYDAFFAKLTRLLTNVGPTSQAASSIKLVKESSRGSFDDFKAQAYLVRWDAVWLGRTEERNSGLFYSNDSAVLEGGWDCVKVESLRNHT